MKKGMLAAVAALALSASAAYAATVDTLTVALSSGAGSANFSLAAAGEYTFTVSDTPFFLSLFNSPAVPGPALAAGTAPLTTTLSAGSYSAFLFGPGFQGSSVTLTISSVDAAVPLPAAAPLLLAAFGGLGFAARRKARKAA